MENLLFIFFLICCAIETGVAFWLIKGIQRKESHDWQHAVSVIIAARNEAKHLPKLLEELKQQQHPSFEVILVYLGSLLLRTRCFKSINSI